MTKLRINRCGGHTWLICCNEMTITAIYGDTENYRIATKNSSRAFLFDKIHLSGGGVPKIIIKKLQMQTYQ